MLIRDIVKWYRLFEEANCSLPSRNASGIWPAFWLLPSTLCWPTGSEIDIFEYGGNTIEDDIFGSYHWGTKCVSKSEMLIILTERHCLLQ